MTTQSFILKDGTAANTLTLENTDGTFSIKKGESGPSTLMSVSSSGITGNVAQQGVPCFSAYGSTQTIVIGANREVIHPSELFDTASCYDTSTGRFTPNVAGYYHISGSVGFSGAASVSAKLVVLLKNGSQTGMPSSGFSTSDTGPWESISVSAVVYLNGTTDYVSVAASCGTTNGVLASSHFSGCLIRAA